MKKILLSLFVGFVGLINFCSALNVSDLIEPIINRNTITVSDGSNYIVHEVTSSSDFGTYCVKLYSSNGHGYFGMSNNENFFTEGRASVFFANWDYPLYVCAYTNLPYLIFHAEANEGDVTIDFELFKLNALLNTEIPKLTSSECQTEYNLIPINSIDENYCVGNGLCPNECGSGTDFSGDLQYSNIYINSILHPGKQNIFIDIPDYITRDYSSTGDDFNLYVGSGYDVDYINSIIDINSYRPDNKDFTDIFVGGLTLITPYIVAILFFYLVWRLLKRIFS